MADVEHWDPALDRAEEYGEVLIEKMELALKRGTLTKAPTSIGRSGTVFIFDPVSGKRLSVEVNLSWRVSLAEDEEASAP
jgi:hypothetical protein